MLFHILQGYLTEEQLAEKKKLNNEPGSRETSESKNTDGITNRGRKCVLEPQMIIYRRSNSRFPIK